MIEKAGRDRFVLSCDRCEDACEEAFETFRDAADYKKDKHNGWRTIKDKNNDWCDLCPACNAPEIIRKLKGVEDL
jgi:hypothetical protein